MENQDKVETYSVWFIASRVIPRRRYLKFEIFVTKQCVSKRPDGSESILVEKPRENTNQILEMRLCNAEIGIYKDLFEWTLTDDENREHQNLLQEIAYNVLLATMQKESGVTEVIDKYVKKKIRHFLFDIPVKGLEDMLAQNLTLALQ